MKSVIIAAVAALLAFALPVQAGTEKPAAPKQNIAAADADACMKAKEDCKKSGKTDAECEKDAAVQAACPKQ